MPLDLIPVTTVVTATDDKGWTERFSNFAHQNFIWLLICCYLCAGFFPGFGLIIRGISFGQVSLLGASTHVSASMVMLAILMINATMSVERVSGLVSSPRLLLAGISANMFLPVVVLYFVSIAMNYLGTSENLEAIIVALSLLSTVPVAGASTAYTQNTDGDLALAVGLVLTSTFLCPLLMHVPLNLINLVAFGDYTQSFSKMEGGGTILVLILAVILPSFFGLCIRPLIGTARIKSAKPGLKLVNSGSLLLLNYTNAAIALPKLFSNLDWGFLASAFIFSTLLCVVDFVSGWWIARLLRATPGQQLAMMFGVGLNNNSTALVLGSLVFFNQPKILVPLIFYGLIQHLVAGGSTQVLALFSRLSARNAVLGLSRA